MTKEKMNRCQDIIHTRAVLAAGAGAGLAQVPGSDSLVIVPIQAEMLKEIGKVFDRNITEQCVAAILGTGLATAGGRKISQVLIGWIPGWGNVTNATTAAAVTEALGWSAAAMFEKGDFGSK